MDGTRNSIRRPTLADLILASDPKASMLERRWRERTQDALRTAKKFVLDAQAASYIAEMIKQHPRVIADAQDFAIPPFERMWIEFPFENFYRIITGNEPDSTGDKSVGYLFQGPTVKVGSFSYQKIDNRYAADWGPAQYVLHKPMTLSEELNIADRLGVSRAMIDLWFWGETAADFIQCPHPPNAFDAIEAVVEGKPHAWDSEGLRALRANHSVELVPIRHHSVWDKSVLPKGLIDGSAGDLRNIVALLLFLNRTSRIQTRRDVPMGQTLINRKPRPMMPHSVITLKLNPMPRLKVLAAGLGVKRRLHDVRGHYCHDRVARESGCPHGTDEMGDWGEWWLEYAPLKWNCSVCNGERWWKRAHHRGSAEIGIVREQTYKVIA